jgi:hypothetical protein
VLVRRLTPVLAAAVVVGLAASGCASQAVGVRVGGETYSQADMVGELEAYGENESLFPPDSQQTAQIQGELAGSFSQDFVSQVVSQRVTYMLVQKVFDDRDLELTADERTVAENQLATRMGNQAVDDFPAKYRHRFVDDEARVLRLLDEMGEDDLNSSILDEARSSEIEVSSRFGDWDENQLQVIPPTGSTAAPGSEPDLGSAPPAGATPSG